jgi:hypothetical protein
VHYPRDVTFIPSIATFFLQPKVIVLVWQKPTPNVERANPRPEITTREVRRALEAAEAVFMFAPRTIDANATREGRV